MGSAEKEADYAAKWSDWHHRLEELLTEVDHLAASEADRDVVRVMRQDIATYDEALRKVLAAIHAGELKTPQEANNAFSAHKDTIRRLEDTAMEFATRHSEAMHGLDRVVADATSHSLWLMVGVILVGFTASIIIGFLITRSITGPIQQVVEVAEQVAEGDL
jgi:methyl-accepting chemotaxis protein